MGGVDWIRLAQKSYRWQAVVNAVMNLGVLAPQIYLVRLAYSGIGSVTEMVFNRHTWQLSNIPLWCLCSKRCTVCVL
jgi:hypothetical protein